MAVAYNKAGYGLAYPVPSFQQCLDSRNAAIGIITIVNEKHTVDQTEKN